MYLALSLRMRTRTECGPVGRRFSLYGPISQSRVPMKPVSPQRSAFPHFRSQTIGLRHENKTSGNLSRRKGKLFSEAYSPTCPINDKQHPEKINTQSCAKRNVGSARYPHPQDEESQYARRGPRISKSLILIPMLVHRIQYYLPFTSTMRPGQALS